MAWLVTVAWTVLALLSTLLVALSYSRRRLREKRNAYLRALLAPDTATTSNNSSNGSNCSKAVPLASPSELARLGEQDGLEALGSERVTAELDAALGVPCALEYYYVEPALYAPNGQRSWAPRSWAWLGFGHAAIRYRLGAVERVFNVAGDSDVHPSRTLFAHLSAHEYLYAVSHSAYARSEQMGVYHRGILGVRLLHVAPAAILRLHECFEELFARAQRKEALFGLRTLHEGRVTRGNCAYWTSLGLVAAGLVAAPSPFPKSVALSLMAHSHHIVHYQRVRHAQRSASYRDWDVDAHGPVAPHLVASSLLTWELDAFAHAVALVPAQSVTLAVVRVPKELTWTLFGPLSALLSTSAAVILAKVCDALLLLSAGFLLAHAAWTQLYPL